MCPPLYYRQGAEERARALSQWRGLYLLLRDQLAVHVDLLEPRPDLPDLAHVGRGGFVVGNTFIASRFSDVAIETGPLENFFLVRGYDIKHLEKEVRFDGSRDITVCNGTLFMGCHPGDAHRAHEEIQAILGSEIVRLELADHWPWPMTSCLCPVGNGQALFCSSAFTDRGREKLEARIPRLVPVDGMNGGAGICDSLIVEKDLIMAESFPSMQPALDSLGINAHELLLDEFSAAGGPRSLTLRIGES